jgi:hypothetical protein
LLESPPYLSGMRALAVQVASDLHEIDLAGRLAVVAIRQHGLASPSRVVE